MFNIISDYLLFIVFTKEKIIIVFIIYFIIGFKISDIIATPNNIIKKPNRLKRALLGAELIAVLAGSFFATYKYADYRSFLKHDQRHNIDYIKQTRENPDIKPIILKLFPDAYPEKMLIDTAGDFMAGECFFTDSCGELPEKVQGVTLEAPDSNTTKQTLFRRLFKLPDIDEYEIGPQLKEGRCVVTGTQKLIQFTTGNKPGEGFVERGIGYNGDLDGSPDVPAMTHFINSQIQHYGYKAEYFLNPHTSDIVNVIRSGGKVLVTINAKGGGPHWVVPYGIKLDADGNMHILFHDSGKTFFDKDGRYVKSKASERKIYEKYISGTKRDCSLPVFQDLMDFGLTGNSGGSAVRRLTGVNSVAIATYDPDCLDKAYADRLFEFSRSGMNDVLKHGVDYYIWSKENPIQNQLIKICILCLCLCWLYSLGRRTYNAVAPRSSPAKKVQ